MSNLFNEDFAFLEQLGFIQDPEYQIYWVPNCNIYFNPYAGKLAWAVLFEHGNFSVIGVSGAEKIPESISFEKALSLMPESFREKLIFNMEFFI